MDPTRFDTLARLVAVPSSRRRLIGGLMAGALGIGATDEASAAICRSLGNTCRETANCCVGECLKDATRRYRCACPPGTKVCSGECIPVSSCCRDTGCCTNADCPSGGYYCENQICYYGCFVAGTRVAMADGTTRPIEAIEVGEWVLGQHGINRVMAIDSPVLGARMLYALNGGRYFVTSSHPFLTETGWKSVDPAGTMVTNPDLAAGRLVAGDRLLTLASVAAPVAIGAYTGTAATAVQLSEVALHGLMGRTADPATLLYNLRLDGDHTYFADDWLVHNK
jgi:hypothetical protein